DRVFRQPDALGEDVAAAMGPPLPAVNTTDPLDDVYADLTGGGTAVVVVRDGKPTAVLTRSDLLEVLAHSRAAPAKEHVVAEAGCPRRLGAGALVDAADPRLEARVIVSQLLVVAQDPMELLVVAVGERQGGVFEERESDAVGSREVLAEEMTSILEQPFEEVEPPAELVAQRGDLLQIRLRLAQLRVDRIRRHLPDPVEPVDEDLELRPGGR